jgi:hypothetical protein
MSVGRDFTEQLTKVSEADRELILKELDTIVASYYFKTSKRYPMFLRYIVDAALDGRAGDLKERTLGVEVFGRDPAYDTSADPVVRFSAGEVRKRIAQYYHENGNSSRVRIEMPLGSYVPEFITRSPGPTGTPLAVALAPADAIARNPTKSPRSRRLIASTAAALMLLAAVFATVWYHKSNGRNLSGVDELWGPFLKSPGQVVIVVGPVLQEALVSSAAKSGAIDSLTGRYDHVSVLSAVALAHLASVLQEYGRTYEVRESTETSLADMRSRPVILIGAVNNAWTMNFLNRLRFRFLFDGRNAKIQDTQDIQNSRWSFDVTDSSRSVTTDYAIVARFHDPTTEGPVLVIAGLGPNGTEVASEFATGPEYIRQVAEKMPADWEKKNFELVIKMDVIGSKAGPPVLISAFSW